MVIKSGKGPYNFMTFNKCLVEITEFQPHPWPADFLSWPAAGVAPRINQMMFTTSPGEDSDQLFYPGGTDGTETLSDDNVTQLESAEKGTEPRWSGSRVA